MNAYTLILKLSSPVFLVIGALHLVYGAGTEVMLGATLSEQSLQDPVLDSQNRFYGISFTLYGMLLYLCSTDLKKYRTVFKSVLCVFFAAGCARIVSITTHGMPSEMVLLLLGSEIALPPILWIWLLRMKANQALKLTLESVLPSLPLWSVAVKGSLASR
jgi:hypothetical protein